MAFDNLGLSPLVVDAIKTAGYVQPTPIQEQAIPPVLARRDLIGIAQTGTGKTASFTLPMLTLLESGRSRARMPRSLILEPTRELAAQVADNFEKYGQNHKLNLALIIGGVSFDEQFKVIDRGADVLIATPGRLLDHFERGKLLLTGVEILVVDEADRMLDMGFIPDIERIIKLIPFTRQTMLFSATMPDEIRSLTHKFLQNPAEIAVAAPSSPTENITHTFERCGGKDYEKRQKLRELIEKTDSLTNAIIFCNRKRDIGILCRSMVRHGFRAGALHGDMDQNHRMATLAQFKSSEMNFLIASDVAARGLDIPTVSHVFNYDVPTHSEDYIHRIGRTGRAGRTGVAATIMCANDQKYVDAIEAMIGKKMIVNGEFASSQSTSESGGNSRKPTHQRKGARSLAQDREKPPARVAKKSTATKPVLGFGEDVPAFMRIPAKVDETVEHAS